MGNCNREYENATFTSNRESENYNRNCDYNIEQHVHEFIGSTIAVERCEDCHNHRFATVSEEAIRSGDSHVHKVKFRTDSHDGHYHEFCGTSSPAIFVGDGRHVHYINACTESADGHTHEFRVASLINDPTKKINAIKQHYYTAEN